MIEGTAQSIRTLAGRYQIGELIGRGGMADVYVGTDSRLGRRVAVKLLKPALANDPTFRTRFRREAQDAAKMAHPTIVRIFDAGEEVVREPNGIETVVPFIVMEYVQGRLLKDIIADGPMEPVAAARIIEQVLTALEYSHRAGVVHRDIKPGNIMVTASGQVKVMDFGIARAISDSQATIAETTAIVGTAQYFSPEQARGEAVDARTDLYSTGVVFFELLTGRPPFRGDNPVAVAYQHVNTEAVPPSSLNPAVSPALDAVVLRSLAKDRFERYQSASEFREDVETAAGGDVPVKRTAANDAFNATLFGVNPSANASDVALRQLAVDNDRSQRTQSRPPVAWIWAGIAVMAAVVIGVVFWAFSLQAEPLTPNAAVTVPDVSGLTWEEGSELLEDAGLRPQRVDIVNPDIPEGVIIDTEPQADLDVSPGFRITVNVSSGAPAIPIPDLANQSQESAILTLEGLGLVVGAINTDYSPSVPAGIVMKTNPASGATTLPDGTKIRAGATVDLYVSNGLVAVPDVAGMTVPDASDTLGGLGLIVRVQPDNSCSGLTISSQSAIGDTAQRSEVTITYCAG